MEIVINSNSKSQNISEFAMFTITNPISLESEVLGPIFSTTVSMKIEEKLIGMSPSITTPSGSKYGQSVQSIIENCSFFNIFAGSVQVTKVIVRIGRTVVTTFGITFLEHKIPDMLLLQYDEKSSFFSSGSVSVHVVTPPNRIGGNFQLSLGGYATPFLLSNSTAETVSTALMALPSVRDDALGVGKYYYYAS